MGAMQQALLASAAAAGSGYDAAVLADSPCLFWKFNETSGTTYADSAPGGTFPGAGSGTITQSQSPVFAGSLRSILGSSTSKIVTASGGPFSSLDSSFSVELCFNINSLAAEVGLASQAPAAGWGMLLRVNTNGSIEFDIVTLTGTGNGFVQCLSASSLIATATDHHVVGVWDRGVGTNLYLDGTLVQSTANVSTSRRATPSAEVAVGLSIGSGAPNLPARVEKFACYNTALSSTRVLAHYNARNT